MFRLPSAWNIQHSSCDECEFSSCEDEPDARAETNPPIVVDNFAKRQSTAALSTLKNTTVSTTVQRKRPSSKLGVSLDDSDIETSPRPQVNHQSRETKVAVPIKSGPLSARVAPSSSIKRAHASASSIEDIEVDSPTPFDAVLLPKKGIPTISSSGNVNGWIKSIPDSLFQQNSVNLRNNRARPNARAAESVLARQLYAAVQRNRETIHSTNHLLNSKNLSALHTREFLLLSVVSCEPCHLPIFPVRVNFCHRKSNSFLPCQILTCYLPIASAKTMGEIHPGDLLIVGQPWRAVGCIDEPTSSLSINIFCSEFVLKCPSVSAKESNFAASACAFVESLPFMIFSTFASRLWNPCTTDFKPSSCEPNQNVVSSIVNADFMHTTKHYDVGYEVMVQAIASVMDLESAICTKDLNFAVPVAIVFVRGDSCATVCYCIPGDFEIISQQLVEKCTCFLKQLVKEAQSDPLGSHFRAFIKSPFDRPAFHSDNQSFPQSSCFGISSRLNMQLQYYHAFSFQTPVDHVLVPENGHGFGRFRFIDSPVYACVIGCNFQGSLIPIFAISRVVADFIFAFLSFRNKDLDAAKQPLIAFEGLNLLPTTLSGSPFVVIADAFTKLKISSSSSSLIAACPSSVFHMMRCHSHSISIIDSFYIGGDQMCQKCNSSCSAVGSDSLCRHCGFSGSSQNLSSGYLPLYLLVSDLSSSASSPQVLQIRSGALSSFIAQYMDCCTSWSDCDAAENLKDSLLFCNSLMGKKMHCCTLAHASIDESIMMYEQRPAWISRACEIDDISEVLQMKIEKVRENCTSITKN